MTPTTKIIVAVSIAAAAGAAIGLLLAPQKGTVLQKKMKDGALDWLKSFSTMMLINQGPDANTQEEVEAEFIRGDISEFQRL